MPRQIILVSTIYLTLQKSITAANLYIFFILLDLPRLNKFATKSITFFKI